MAGAAAAGAKVKAAPPPLQLQLVGAADGARSLALPLLAGVEEEEEEEDGARIAPLRLARPRPSLLSRLIRLAR